MQRLHHVAVFTADYARTLAFYRDVFDATAPDSPNQPSVFTMGGVTLHVVEHSDGSASWAPTHFHHIALQTDDLAEFARIRESLLARGSSDGSIIHFGDHISMLARDPDGGMIELLCAIEPGEELPFSAVLHE